MTRGLLPHVLAVLAAAMGCQRGMGAQKVPTETRSQARATAAVAPVPIERSNRSRGGESAPDSAPGFTYGGRAIHPLCVLALAGVGHDGEQEVALSDCAEGAGPPKKRGTTFTYVFPEELAPPGRRPMVEYQLVTFDDGLFYLRYLYNGGGTSYFSGLVAVARDDAHIRAEGTIASGDRCNGGIVGAKADEEGIVVEVNQTPPDILELTTAGRGLSMKAYEDLEASAGSCFAVARYRYEAAKGTYRFVDVQPHVESTVDRAGWTSQFAHQSCFNSVFQRFVGKRLDRAQLDGFAKAFAQSCLAP